MAFTLASAAGAWSQRQHVDQEHRKLHFCTAIDVELCGSAALGDRKTASLVLAEYGFDFVLFAFVIKIHLKAVLDWFISFRFSNGFCLIYLVPFRLVF